MGTIDAIIETPKGSNAKFTYDPKSGFFELKKILPLGMVFPFDFGFIPGTKGEDGDPLDIVVFSEIATFTGCKMKCRLTGSIQAIQTEKDKTSMRNDRFFAVAEDSFLFKKVRSSGDLPSGWMEELKAFFVQYNKLSDKEFKITGTSNAKQSLEIIHEGKIKAEP